MKVEVAVLGSPSLIILVVCVDVKGDVKKTRMKGRQKPAPLPAGVTAGSE